MQEHADSGHQLRVESGFPYPHGMDIDPRRERFPCCIVWTPLPVLSWFIPIIGHVGICREDGTILDFAGPNFVCVDHFPFGPVARYLQINKDKECSISPHSSALKGDVESQLDDPRREPLTWDDALQKSTMEFQHRAYSLFTCNCHSFVANNLNRLGFRSGGWNVVTIVLLVLLKGQWVNRVGFLRSFLPFVVVSCLGLVFGGTTYLFFLALFAALLVGWFLLGTYCFKNLIQL
ncbi:Protein RTE1-HOMOLOG [Hibiscus syriacus]|uniref:Protein RTE1-HOMOLOG n=1 Tax=Hibiscus syriacus TaxID=106335 RepID=A0A6A3BPH5_HIBSY|nr:protein RTE1-HOMOLOG-like [Hibiscus syriacus]XP_039066733.1 protein RTE1-HOMOLOG-like [Hibiscus syriacus]KAE8718494.1 Protein RTE1-HOMOLOG [Hibiscus syriacus]